MSQNTSQGIINDYTSFIQDKTFPCVAARAAMERQQVKCMVADHIACPHNDNDIIQFMYNFIDEYRAAGTLFHSASVIFAQPDTMDESMFEHFLWQRLQALVNIDAMMYRHDKRVSADPASSAFSFSLKEEAFFIIGMHPASSREARRFRLPVLAFNPHAQFESLRESGGYAKIKNVVRKRDIALSGSINPMLDDFGTTSEVRQYSGKQYDNQWKCPLMINNDNYEYHPAT